MKKIVFGIIVFFIAFNFVARIPLIHADVVENGTVIDPAEKAVLQEALTNLTNVLLEMQQNLTAEESQLSGVNSKDTATLGGALDTLRGLLAEIQMRLVNPDQGPAWDKIAVNTSLTDIKGNLTSINGTLVALQSEAAIASNPAATPIAQAPQSATPPAVTTQNENVPASPISSAPVFNEAIPQTARAAASFDYGVLAWPAIFTGVGIAVVASWFWRKEKNEAVAVDAGPKAKTIIRSPFEEPELPVELPTESLFPSRIEPVFYSPLRSVVNPPPAVTPSRHDFPQTTPGGKSIAESPIITPQRSAFPAVTPVTIEKPVIHPPTIHLSTQKEHEPKKAPIVTPQSYRKPAP